MKIWKNLIANIPKQMFGRDGNFYSYFRNLLAAFIGGGTRKRKTSDQLPIHIWAFECFKVFVLDYLIVVVVTPFYNGTLPDRHPIFSA